MIKKKDSANEEGCEFHYILINSWFDNEEYLNWIDNGIRPI